MPAFFDPLAWRRRAVLGIALVAALGAIAVSPQQRVLVTPAFAQAPAAKDTPAAKSPAPKDPAVKPAPAAKSAPAANDAGAGDATTGDGNDAAASAAPAEPAAPAAKRRTHGASIGVTIDDDDHVRVSGLGPTHEYDSFADFVDRAPWIAGGFFFIVLLVFLLPLMVIVLVLWYKMRKNRMLNETMLKLAEKGVVPPAEAMDAIGAGRPQAAIAGGDTTGALYARALRIRATSAWSDLRRGIVLVAVGLAVQTCSMIDDGEANGIGLVLLFLGVGYVVLWYFEGRAHPVASRLDRGTDMGTDMGTDRTP